MKNPEALSSDKQEQSLSEEETFLQRWSRRKLDAEHVITEKVENTAESVTADYRQQYSQTELSPEPLPHELTDEDMPSVDTLDEHSDYTGFMSPKVSETLRRQALRKLFHLPEFNITDGLNDYDGDFTQFAGLGNVVTNEMKRMLAREAEKLAAETGNMQSQPVTDQQINPADNSGQAVAHNEKQNLNTLAADNQDTDVLETDEQVKSRSSADI